MVFPQATQQTAGAVSPIRLKQLRSKHFQIDSLPVIPSPKVQSDDEAT